MAEVHIFDFDGTIFYSPAPTHSAVAHYLAASGGAAPTPSSAPSEEANKLYGSLLNPVDAGGYGWFQSIHTMSPPAVPAAPEPAMWYVAPVLQHMRALVERRNALMRSPATRPEELPLLYVLTGRDVKYYDRIWTLLEHVGMDKEVEDVILKPHETAGTVMYKLNSFFKLIQYHKPSRVFYYEDRVEQGGRLLEGMRVLEQVLYYSRHSGGPSTSSSPAAAADRVGVVTFDVKATAPLASQQQQDGEAPVMGSALHTPQPQVDRKFAAGAAADQADAAPSPRHALLTSTLRSSPYELLRDACYPLDRLSVFYPGADDAASDEKARKAAEHAERQAQKWVSGTVDFWNAKNSGGGSGGRGRGRGTGRGRDGPAPAKKAAAEFDAKALHESIRFSVAPPFVFVMVLLPAALCDRSDDMLTAGQFSSLVERLKQEREERR